MVEALNLFALENLAKEKMPEAAWGYYATITGLSCQASAQRYSRP